jgi:hypothetical protein
LLSIAERRLPVAGREFGHYFFVSNWRMDRGLTADSVSVDDDEGQPMKRPILSAILWLGFAGVLCGQAQEPKPGTQADTKEDKASQDDAKDNAPGDDAAAATRARRLRIEVTGGEKNVAVENASVYLKYVEEKKLRKDRLYALNVKTNRDGAAHIPDPPLGRVLIQIVADGWKTYGKYYELTDPGMVIRIHLDRPPKWY